MDFRNKLRENVTSHGLGQRSWNWQRARACPLYSNAPTCSGTFLALSLLCSHITVAKNMISWSTVQFWIELTWRSRGLCHRRHYIGRRGLPVAHQLINFRFRIHQNGNSNGCSPNASPGKIYEPGKWTRVTQYPQFENTTCFPSGTSIFPLLRVRKDELGSFLLIWKSARPGYVVNWIT